MSSKDPYEGCELLFWLQILGDHARFIQNSLHPNQTNLSMIAGNFIELFDRILDRAREFNDRNELFMKTCGTEILQTTLSFRDFKRELLADSLKNKPLTSLSPIFYNHMLNELEDFLRVLSDIESGRQNEENILGHHLLWVLDAAAHAGLITSDLDKVENSLIETSRKFQDIFDQDYIKVVELTGYFRSTPPAAAPLLASYNVAIAGQMKEFMVFLEEIKTALNLQRISGRLGPLMPDHMYREECYYLLKIARNDPNISMPDCDPGRPRTPDECINKKESAVRLTPHVHE